MVYRLPRDFRMMEIAWSRFGGCVRERVCHRLPGAGL